MNIYCLCYVLYSPVDTAHWPWMAFGFWASRQRGHPSGRVVVLQQRRQHRIVRTCRRSFFTCFHLFRRSEANAIDPVDWPRFRPLKDLIFFSILTSIQQRCFAKRPKSLFLKTTLEYIGHFILLATALELRRETLNTLLLSTDSSMLSRRLFRYQLEQTTSYFRLLGII